MRVWLNPQRMDALGITVDEVSAAIQRQNIQATLGQAGAPPMRVGTELQYTLVAQGRLRDTDEFGGIVIRTGADGSKVFLRDIARLELGARNYASRASFAGHESAMLQINQSPDANAIQTANAVQAELERLSSRFPPGLQYHVVYDATRFVEASLQLTARTLFEAFVIVLVVTFIFLQDWRATLISALAIPASMLGAVAVLLAVGYSLNMISLRLSSSPSGLWWMTQFWSLKTSNMCWTIHRTFRLSKPRVRRCTRSPGQSFPQHWFCWRWSHPRPFGRHWRSALPAIRRDDLVGADPLFVRRLDAQSGACSPSAQTRRWLQARSSGLVFKLHGENPRRLRQDRRFSGEILDCTGCGHHRLFCVGLFRFR